MPGRCSLLAGFPHRGPPLRLNPDLSLPALHDHTQTGGLAVTDQCGVRWGDHACRYDNDGHLVGVDCECHCEDPATESGYPYLGAGHTDFRLLSDPVYGDQAQRNYDYSIRFGVA